MDKSERSPAAGIPGILILTHGKAGEELIRSAEMIVGAMERVKNVSLMPGVGADEFAESVKQIVEDLPEGSLIISDIFGGTPANTSAMLARTHNVSAVSGLSLGMLLETLSLRESMRGEQLAEAVIRAGREGCRNIVAALRQMNEQGGK